MSAWERSLRPGQYFSEKGGHRPMRHRTQAVQGHPGARAWPRGPDGGAWGPQDLSPIPSEKGYMPLVRRGGRGRRVHWLLSFVSLFFLCLSPPFSLLLLLSLLSFSLLLFLFSMLSVLWWSMSWLCCS